MRTTHLLAVLLAISSCFSKPGKIGPGDDVGDDQPPPEDAQQPDAPPDAFIDLCTPAAALCDTAGGQCMNGACVIDRSANTLVTCPAAMPCIVTCTGIDACDAGVRCGMASECSVRCSTRACGTGGVDCGLATKCNVRCLGASACRRGPDPALSVECHASMCDVTCAQGNGQTCEDGINAEPGGMCKAHCCDGACGTVNALCTRDTTCI